MSAITNLWRQLVQRRLWPVAILLIAALAGVPLALAKEPEAAAPAPAVASADSGESALAVEPIVAKATASDRSKRRKVLGTRKNPFGVPKQDAAAGSAAAANSNGSTTAQEPASDSQGSSGGTTPSSGSSPSTSAPVVPATPAPAPKTYAINELTVRFGDASGMGLERMSLKRLQPLPSAEDPVLIYLGVLRDGKTAVFLVDHGVSAVGDGDCRPTPEECETLRLTAGETEFLDVTDDSGTVAQYQLDLIKIHKASTTSATRAQASSKAGQRLLKARVSADGPTGYRWDAAAGALERRPGQALRATVAGATVALP
jgi:hypothetical protein